MTLTEQLEDGMVLVTVAEYGFREQGIVSSWHLVEPKANQLRQVIKNKAEGAYVNP